MQTNNGDLATSSAFLLNCIQAPLPTLPCAELAVLQHQQPHLQSWFMGLLKQNPHQHPWHASGVRIPLLFLPERQALVTLRAMLLRLPKRNLEAKMQQLVNHPLSLFQLTQVTHLAFPLTMKHLHWNGLEESHKPLSAIHVPIVHVTNTRPTGPTVGQTILC